MITNSLAFVLVLLASGCGGIYADPSRVVAPPDGSAEVTALVSSMYQMKYPPVIYDGSSVVCAGGYGKVTHGGSCQPYAPYPVMYFYRSEESCDGGFEVDGGCYAGVTSNDGGMIIVAAPRPGVPYGQDTYGVPGDATIPHEVGHASSVQRGEGVDHDHLGHFFAPGGEVARATQMLSDLGL